MDDFNSKTIFITGTDTGFGRLLALKLDRLGLKVYAGCLTEAGAESLRKEASSRLKTVQIDVSNRDSILQAKDEVEKDLKPDQELWGLVNNAGICQGSIFLMANIEDYRRVMEVNFFGVINVTEIFMPLIKKSRGRIVNVISILGRCAGTAEPYTCSKYALEPYTDGLRIWMSTYGIHVAAIEPGHFPTYITSIKTNLGDVNKSWDKLDPKLKEEYGGDEYLKAAEVDVQRGLSIVENINVHLNHVGMVPKAIIHALGAVHPKCRYVVGLDAQFIYRFYAFVPDWFAKIIMWIFTRQYTFMSKRMKKHGKLS